MRIVGLDDGYSQTKVATGTQWSLCPTRIQSGRAFQAALPGGDGPAGYLAQADGSEWTVGPDLPRPADIAHDDYPGSVEARVVATHAMLGALRQEARWEEEVSVCSGVPLDRTLGGHETLVEAKRSNLLRNDVAAINGAGAVPVGFRIVRHEVVAEAVGAWIADIAAVADDGGISIPRTAMEAHVAVVDIGSRTTDIAVVWHGAVDAEASRTVEVGVAQMRARLSEAVARAHGARLDAVQAEAALRNGRARVYGKPMDVSGMRESAVGAVLSQLRNEVRSALGDGSQLDRVLFVGGGVHMAEATLREWFPHARIAESPVLANVVGFQLYGRMAFADG